jgi:predicted HTH domain antitoxin
MTEQLNLRISKDLIQELEKLAETSNLDRTALAKKILIEGIQREKLNLAIQKYINKEISIERAAEITGLSLYELIEVFSRLGVPSNLSIEDIQKLLE